MDEGENLGVIATSEALKLAQEQGMDLVVITEAANPPVAKILDFKKFLYEENKKQTQIKTKSKKSETKELRIGAQTDEGGIKVKADRAIEFLEDGNRVKITVVLKGREKAYPELGMEKAEKFIAMVGDIARIDGEIKQSGGQINAILVKR